MLNAFGVSSKIDDAGQAIGRRYARTDECGIPYALTVDQNTLDRDEITIRELDEPFCYRNTVSSTYRL